MRMSKSGDSSGRLEAAILPKPLEKNRQVLTIQASRCRKPNSKTAVIHLLLRLFRCTKPTAPEASSFFLSRLDLEACRPVSSHLSCKRGAKMCVPDIRQTYKHSQVVWGFFWLLFLLILRPMIIFFHRLVGGRRSV